MKNIVTALLLLAVVAGMQGTLLVQSVFVVRYDFVAQHLCEKRHDPAADCDGFCFLAERVAEAHGEGDEATLQSSAHMRADATCILPARLPVPTTQAGEVGYPEPTLLAPASGVSPAPFRPPWEREWHG